MYKHRALKESRSIRLLNIIPPSIPPEPEAPISCELSEVALDSNPRYDALSYSWDAQKPEVPIRCNGKELLITKNCHEALLRLRRLHLYTLWIDAICIDQTPEAEEERSKQVSLMGDVYSQARRVVIWIGESTQVSDDAMQFLKDVVRVSQKKHFRNYSLKRKMRQLYRADAKSVAAGTTLLGILESVFERSWFTRMWTVQEVALGRYKIVMCGSRILPWDELVFGLETVSIQENVGRPWGDFEGSFGASISCPAFFESLLRRRRMLEKHGAPRPKPPTLSVVLFEAQRQKATEPKDAIYGIYSLLSALGIDLPTPDYSKSVAQIYSETARTAILQNNSLEILYQVPSSRKIDNLPSWVPDFNEHNGHYPYWKVEQFSSSRKSTAKFEFKDKQKLSVLGKCVGSIISRSETVIGWTEAEEFEFTHNMDVDAGFLTIFEPYVKAYREWCELAGTLESYPTGQSVLGALCHTLVHDEPQRKEAGDQKWDIKSFARGFSNWHSAVSAGMFEYSMTLDFLSGVVEGKYLPNKKSLDKFFSADDRKNLDAVKDTLIYKIQAWLHAHEPTRTYDYVVQTRMRTSRLVITSEGYMGTTPPMAKVGDRIVLVAGLSLPMIVRREGEGDRLIGPAYIHGIMDGERWPEVESDLEWINFV